MSLVTYEGKQVKSEVDLTPRRNQIKQFFKEVKSVTGCHIKFSNKEPYETWDSNRLLEHVLYWLTFRTTNRKYVDEQFKKPGFIEEGSNRLIKEPVVYSWINLLF